MTVKYYARLVLNTCAESRKFCELVLFFFFFCFFFVDEGKGYKYHEKRNWRADDGIWTNIAKKAYCFVIFQRGPDPAPPPPSGSAHVPFR